MEHWIFFLNGHACWRRHHHSWKPIAPHLWCSRNRRQHSQSALSRSLLIPACPSDTREFAHASMAHSRLPSGTFIVKSRFWQLLKFHKTIRGASFGSPFSYALSHTFSYMIMYLWSESVKKCNCLARCSVIWWCVTDTCCRCTGVDDLSISYINTYMVDIASAGIE